MVFRQHKVLGFILPQAILRSGSIRRTYFYRMCTKEVRFLTLKFNKTSGVAQHRLVSNHTQRCVSKLFLNNA